MKEIKYEHLGAALIGAPLGAVFVSFLPLNVFVQWSLGVVIVLLGLFLLFFYKTEESGGKNE